MNKKTTSAVAVHLVFVDSQYRVLLGKRINTSYQDNIWQTPAGHVELCELPTEAAQRKAKEEVGVDVSRDDLNLIHVSARPCHDETGNRLDLFFRVMKYTGKIQNMEPDKCEELKWFSLSDLPENMTPHVHIGVRNGLRRIFSSELTLEEMREFPIYGFQVFTQ